MVVVDDDDAFRRVVRRLLRRRGLVVVAEAGDGAGALEAVQRHRPDGVLLDVHLPDGDGLAVGRALTGASPAAATAVRPHRRSC